MIGETGSFTVDPVPPVEIGGEEPQQTIEPQPATEPVQAMEAGMAAEIPVTPDTPQQTVTHTFGPANQQPAAPEPVKEDAPLAFDAYYTIDYFASQGIKAPAEVQPGDKLGKQLKSFTEWLKTMKRLPQAPAEVQTDEREQQHIRQFAAGSLEEKEVVTETMAEVLAKQDKKDEAIAIYEKLSLLDPSKSGYFAAKIENLKVN